MRCSFLILAALFALSQVSFGVFFWEFKRKFVIQNNKIAHMYFFHRLTPLYKMRIFQNLSFQSQSFIWMIEFSVCFKILVKYLGISGVNVRK